MRQLRGWTGFAVVIYLAALQGVPQTLTEAAAIDGAGAWTTFRRVTLPLLSPASLFLAVWLTINALQLSPPPRRCCIITKWLGTHVLAQAGIRLRPPSPSRARG